MAVVETEEFLTDVKGVLSEEEHDDLILYVALHPESGDVIPDTGGLRKLRWTAKGSHRRAITASAAPQKRRLWKALARSGRIVALSEIGCPGRQMPNPISTDKSASRHPTSGWRNAFPIRFRVPHATIGRHDVAVLHCRSWIRGEWRAVNTRCQSMWNLELGRHQARRRGGRLPRRCGKSVEKGKGK
jgi:hypothetical protein